MKERFGKPGPQSRPMDPADLPDEALFEGALQCRTAAERAAYLDRVCAGQPELRNKLERLLEAHDLSGTSLEHVQGQSRLLFELRFLMLHPGETVTAAARDPDCLVSVPSLLVMVPETRVVTRSSLISEPSLDTK